MKDPIELLCSHCGERFKIGIDSQFVTDEDLLQFLKRSGADAVIHVGTPTRKPDLVQHRTLDTDQRIANLKKLDAIVLDLAQGEQRAWYCDACKGTNDYPKEWHRGAKKETNPPIPNPKCDVCSKEVMRDTGYSLSTSQVTGDSNYWKFTFLNYPAHIHAIGSDGKRLIPFVIERSGDPGAWLVCDQCIRMFTVEDVDMVKAVEMVKAWLLCQEQWTEKGSLVPRQLGPAQWEQSLIAACEGWKKVFGSEPKPDRDDTAIPDAIAIYTSARVHWEQGSSDSSLVVIGGPAKVENKVEEPKQKNWLQFWK